MNLLAAYGVLLGDPYSRTPSSASSGCERAQPEARNAYQATRIRNELGRAVREHREAVGVTQARLAEAAGLQQPAVARFEAGGTMPTLPSPSTAQAEPLSH